jgi:hypothetical protein
LKPFEDKHQQISIESGILMCGYEIIIPLDWIGTSKVLSKYVNRASGKRLPKRNRIASTGDLRSRTEINNFESDVKARPIQIKTVPTLEISKFVNRIGLVLRKGVL